MVDVEREEDKVIITVGAGGAFASGSAQLTPEAIEIMNRIAEINADGTSDIKVSGHTDDVPLIFGSNYRDNWDLAAARSASVVQAFAANGTISKAGFSYTKGNSAIAVFFRGTLYRGISLANVPTLARNWRPKRRHHNPRNFVQN